MFRQRSVLVALLIAQTWIPQQQACDKRNPAPSPGSDPWANFPVTESMTTADGARIGVQVLLTNLEIPWSMVFAPDGRMFFTERVGRVRVVQNGQLVAQPMFTFTDVLTRTGNESGALGMALHPNFAQNHFVYVAYSAQRAGNTPVNRIVRFRESNNTLVDAAVILDNVPTDFNHAGSRIRFGPDGKLYVTTGDASNPDLSQTLSSLAGKILRLNDDGTTPADNPYGSPVWTWGHRHPQGLDWHPATGDLWATEHGGSQRDELNRVVRGQNYGWPIIQGADTRPDMVTPAIFYVPTVAPSGLSFYNGTRIPQFRNNIFFASLAAMHIHRVRLDPNDATRPSESERLFTNVFGRIRDVVTGPDGYLYFCTSNRDARTTPSASDDRIARIVPIQ